MGRISKIAKLPHSIREDLNLRLERSDTARSILEWLNPIPEVQELLKLHFNGDAVNEQNITNWRRSGFAVWQTRHEFFDRLYGRGAKPRQAVACALDQDDARIDAAPCEPFDVVLGLRRKRVGVAIARDDGDPRGARDTGRVERR